MLCWANRAVPISVWLREGSAVTSALPKAPQLGDLLLLEQGLGGSGLSSICWICCCGINGGNSAVVGPSLRVPRGYMMAQGCPLHVPKGQMMAQGCPLDFPGG